MHEKLTMNTLIPIGMVLTIGSGFWWAATVNEKVSDIPQIRSDVASLREDVAAIRARLGVPDKTTASAEKTIEKN